MSKLGAITIRWAAAMGLATVFLAGVARAADEESAPPAAVDAPADEAPAPPAAVAEPAGEEAGDDADLKRVGHTLRLALPITSDTDRLARRFVDRVLAKAQKEAYKPVLIFEFHIPPKQEEFGRGSQFGAALELARYLSSDAMNAATTVAYIPQSIQGHAVLVALACDEVIMAPDATIGSAGIDEKAIDDFILSGYRQITQRRRTVPVEVALGMLDPAHEVLEVNTEVSREFVTPEGLEELRKTQTIRDQKVLIAAGEPGQFTGSEARRLGFTSALAGSLRDAARALELPPEALEQDIALADTWRPVRIDLRGPITARDVEQIRKSIEKAVVQDGANFICLWIESQGGSPADSAQLASYLALDLESSKIRTVAYVPREALADAAVIAMACNQVVVGPNAKLGGWGTHELSPNEIDDLGRLIREKLAREASRSWSLPVALIDPNLQVSRCTRLGMIEFFCEEERQEQPNADEWKAGEAVTSPGSPLQTTGAEAVEYRLADHVADDFEGFKALYGLEHDPALAAPTWADHLVEALASPGVAVLLLIIGGAALYAELHTPGIGIGGFLAFVCFVLFFWSAFSGKTAGWLEVMLFLTGFICVLLEIFVLPGFGIFGLGGGLLIVVSLVLATQTFIFPRNPYQMAQLQSSLTMIAAAAIGSLVLAVLMNRWLPNAPVLGRIMLSPPSPEEKERIRRKESPVDFDRLVGQEGVTTTQLTPSGKARFGDRLVDVISDVELIEPNTRIVVVEVHGNRVMVEPVEPA